MLVAISILRAKIPVSEELNKIELYLHRIVLFCGKEKSKFIKNEDSSGLLSKLEIRTRLIKVTLIHGILF